ncbi:hypothetical protein [Streptomyces thermolilacinus]|uniref:Restriction endonuclease type IV Mrr domain-containing protein n=1 Tax=Streptomyces thermolilacinus SPC6 TaxID=1306406 RepID=A0A1D3DN18_9ACTN|nr:hypothetical protein [Streptomyces thermolilacinus]OEJ93719.1 hypothetical protein J116_003775 [Streptomyces thermolilacinus SPC6]
MGDETKGAIAVGENVPVRCPVCRRAHAYTPPVYPCACGAPVAPPLMRGAPAEPITHRTWTDEWVTVRCAACGRQDQWPQPELGCPCGTVLRLPVRPVTAAASPPRSLAGGSGGASGAGGARGTGVAGGTAGVGPGTTDAGAGAASGAETPGGPADQESTAGTTGPGDPGATSSTTGVSTVRAAAPYPTPPGGIRPSFNPVTIRTARDVVTAAALYLRWLGFREVVQPEERRSSMSPAVELRGPGLVAQVDPTTRPVPLRAVECLWLEGLASSSAAVYFSLAGYEDRSRARADGVGLPLFVMDLTGTPQPVNTPADDLLARGA